MDKKDSYEGITDSMRKSIEDNEKIRDSVVPILEQQERIQQIVDTVKVPRIDISSSAIESIKSISENSAVVALQESASVVNQFYESNSAVKMLNGMGTAIEALQNSSAVHALGEIAMKSAFLDYQFESPALRPESVKFNASQPIKSQYFLMFKVFLQVLPLSPIG
ncbi:MAG: hypothetical protein PUI41_00245 [Lachnospiraceae bacterium]|nr:hypothetical protein [Lachnospiraceae bacterium]MDY4095841.1 hypothetical protein [Lachnospiraceae bacterium]